MEMVNSFLIDEDLSPLLVQKLNELGYSAVAVRQINGLLGNTDNAIVEYAKKNNAIIITSDLDFGELWYWYYAGSVGIIVLRLEFQNINSQISAIEYLHREGMLENPKLKKSLLIGTEHKYRLRQSNNFPNG